jgi:hypothetical protein
MSEALWAALAFLLGWKASSASGGHPAAAAHAATSGAGNAVHQVVTQASDAVWSTVWTVAWHVVILLAVVLALVYGASLVLRQARRNVTGR